MDKERDGLLQPLSNIICYLNFNINIGISFPSYHEEVVGNSFKLVSFLNEIISFLKIERVSDMKNDKNKK